MANQTVVNEIRKIMESIVNNAINYNIAPTITGYTNQRMIINSVFKTDGYTLDDIKLRLTVIDSLYSTNAAYNYFSIDQMAVEIAKLGPRCVARNYFYSIAEGGEDKYDLFGKSYGILKNLEKGDIHISLMSKYAYYELLQEPCKYPLGFPIYDSLAKKAYKAICKKLGIKPINRNSKKPVTEIKHHVRQFNQLREVLFDSDCIDSNGLFCGYQQYDVLDAYLWRMGKFNGGNLSLLLSKQEYDTFIKNIFGNNKYKIKKGNKQSGKGSSKFDEIVGDKLASGKYTTPFGNNDHMNELYEHWKKYYAEEGRNKLKTNNNNN